MPTYRFRNMNTGEEFEEFMSMSERETYLKTHSVIAQVPVPIAIAGDHLMGVGPKVDSGFNERMQQIANSHPGSPLADRYGKPSHKEIKTRNVLKKHKDVLKKHKVI